VRLVVQVNQDVGRLQVAMQDAAFVGVMHRFGDGFQVVGSAPGGQRLAAHQPRQALALDPIHHEEVLPLVDADFVNGDDVRMVQTRRRNRFRMEPFDQFRLAPGPVMRSS
jgi:hypothetical protein